MSQEERRSQDEFGPERERHRNALDPHHPGVGGAGSAGSGSYEVLDLDAVPLELDKKPPKVGLHVYSAAVTICAHTAPPDLVRGFAARAPS